MALSKNIAAMKRAFIEARQANDETATALWSEDTCAASGIPQPIFNIVDRLIGENTPRDKYELLSEFLTQSGTMARICQKFSGTFLGAFCGS